MSVARQIVAALRTAKDVTIVIHQRPDGDAIGSAVALQLALQQLGKTTRVACIQAVPAVFGGIVGPIATTSSFPTTTDLAIILDCAEIHRTGFGRQLERLRQNHPVAAIDHHSAGDLQKIASHYHVDQKASATAEIIFDYLTELRCPISPPMATALLMGIYTDTGGFQHANTTSRTFQLAARLIRCGANLNLISQAFLRTFNPGKKRLWGKILSQIRLNRWGVVTAIINSDDLLNAEATADDILGLANTLALTHEARAALVMVEVAGSWRGILRTRHTTVDVSRLAEIFGGKGQKKAAGFTATKDIFSGKIGR